jgi:signal peptidase I
VSETRAEAPAQSAASAFWDQASTLIFAIVIALAIRSCVIEPFRIPSGSMLPTLLIGDHLFVNKFIYGVKIPFTDMRLPDFREPERGDVIVFTVAKGPYQATHPADERPDLPTEEYVKRIVGLPGDRVEVHNDIVTLNGKPMDVRKTGKLFEDPSGRELQIEDVHVDGRTYQVLDDPTRYGLTQEPMTVPEGRYFVLGDNRDHSKDSRDWGTVRLAEIKGPAWFIYFSWDFHGGWADVLNPVTWWQTKKRWDRTFERLD